MSGTGTSTTSKSTTMVPNPMHQALSALYSKLQGDAPTMSNALKPAETQMGGGQTWVGPAAQSWNSELSGHSRDCGTQVSYMLAEVEQHLRSEPAQVTIQEAEQKAKELELLARGPY